jgi:hypothetical protein
MFLPKRTLIYLKEYEIQQKPSKEHARMMSRHIRGISTLALILLLLCSVIFGALLSYLWVMANFYLEPENTIDLVITEINFPVDHADYFNLTVMNPSHSISAVNITKIFFSLENDTTMYDVQETFPSLPITIERGSIKTIVCYKNWGNFAGETITVHVLSDSMSGASSSFKTKFVKLEAEAYFNATESCKYFNITIRNNALSAINLTIEKIYFNYLWEIPKENMTMAKLPMSLENGSSVNVRCFYDWGGQTNPAVRVETQEGYFVDALSNASAAVLLTISDVEFSGLDTTRFNLTISNSPESTTPVKMTDIELSYGSVTYHVNGTLTEPRLPYWIYPNSTITFINCVWDWSGHRSQNVTIKAYTEQGFISNPITVETPPSIVYKIIGYDFKLTETNNFTVTIKNMPISTQNITVTEIRLQEALLPFNETIPVGEEKQLHCEWNWSALRGQNVNLTVVTREGVNITESLILPSVKLEIIDVIFGNSDVGTPYINVTVSNTEFSIQALNITQITIGVKSAIYSIDGTLTNPAISPHGCQLAVNSTIVIVCPWNWTLYLGQEVTVTVQTAEGYNISQTFQIPTP